MSSPVIIGGATLYLGDCLEILPTLGARAVITDQPYGTGYVRGGGAVGVFNAKHEKPDWDVFSMAWMGLLHADCVVATFCPPSRLDDTCAAFLAPCVARYRKTNVRPGGKDREWIVCSAPWRAARWEVVAYNGDNDEHPTQKPIPVMDWVVNNAPIDRQAVIVDPFMGSGSTGVACMGLGRVFVGVEIDPEFFERACIRMETAQRQARMFA